MVIWQGVMRGDENSSIESSIERRFCDVDGKSDVVEVRSLLVVME